MMSVYVGRLNSFFLQFLFILIFSVAGAQDASATECGPNPPWNIGGSDTQEEEVDDGQICVFKGIIKNVNNIHGSPPTLEWDGNGCDGSLVYLGCSEHDWVAAGCEEGTVEWSTNDSSYWELEETYCCEEGDHEICGNGEDDDCDGHIDEDSCTGNFSISGDVTFQPGGAAIEDAVMTAGNGVAATSTDADGEYSFDGLAADPYTIRGYKVGYDIAPDNFTNPVSVGPDAPNTNLVASCHAGFELEDGECVPIPGCQNIDFEGLAPGSIVTDQYAALGLTVSVVGSREAIIFDSANPTGGDDDLETPGYHPSNTVAYDNVLIIAEDLVDDNDDGLVDDPDDNGTGGWLKFVFDEPRDIPSITILDIEESGSFVRGYDEDNNIIFQTDLDDDGDNSVQTLDLSDDAIGVKKLKVKLKSSGAVIGFEACPQVYNISGRAFIDGTTIVVPGVSITSDPDVGSDLTNASGEYILTDVAPGDYTLSASKTGYIVVDEPDPNPVQVVNADLTNQDFFLACAPGFELIDDECKPVYSISGFTLFQTEAGPVVPLTGVNVDRAGIESTTSAALGAYQFTNVPEGSYQLTATRAGYVLIDEPDPNPVVVMGGDLTNQNFTFTCATGFKEIDGVCVRVYSISGFTLFQTSTGSLVPLTDVTVTGGVLGSTTSAALGAYVFNNVPNDTYFLNASKPGYVVVEDPDPNPVTVFNANLTNQNFILACAEGFKEIDGVCVAVYNVSGTVTLQDNGLPIPGVTISGIGTTTTNGAGGYIFTMVPNGSYTLTASKPNYVVVTDPDPNPVTVFNADLPNQNFVLTCAPGFVVDGADCVEGDTPITIDASDGTSTEHVVVTWETDDCAVTYQLFRSIDETKVFDAGTELEIAGIIPAITGVDTQVFFDTSAVPGVTYFYGAIAFGTDGTECKRTNKDPGFRLGTFDDCDGDGVSDDEELAQGTDPCDPGSFVPRLKSPAYAKWNTFLTQSNFLELIATGSKTANVLVTVFSISGEIVGTQSIELAPGQQLDVDINVLAKDIDTYGITKIEWNDDDPEVRLAGRMSVYRLDPNGESFSFAFARELLNPVLGRTYATGNSFDPQGKGFLVPNWGEIINVETDTRTFTFRLFNQSGELIFQRDVTMPGLSERDLTLGHEFGEGVYLAEVTPHDGATNYLFTAARYSSNQVESDEAETYNYAFSRAGIVGTGDMQYAPITNLEEGCYTQTNWLELVNTREIPTTATAVFRNQAGQISATEQVTLAPRTQFHLLASNHIPKGERGVVEVAADVPGSVIAQSVVYYRGCDDGLAQTAYISPGRIAASDVLMGSYNRFLEIQNMLHLVNTIPETVNYTLEVRTNGEVINTVNDSLGGSLTLAQNLSDENLYATSTDTYGTITIRAEAAGTLIGDVVRVRIDPFDSDRIDFAIQTPLKPE